MATPKKTMEKLNMKEVFPKLTHAEQVYVKKVERENYQRAQSVKTMRRKNFRWATGLCLFVAGTYFYTMYAIRQEKYEEFDEVPDVPEPKGS